MIFIRTTARYRKRHHQNRRARFPVLIFLVYRISILEDTDRNFLLSNRDICIFYENTISYDEHLSQRREHLIYCSHSIIDMTYIFVKKKEHSHDEDYKIILSLRSDFFRLVTIYCRLDNRLLQVLIDQLLKRKKG